MSPNLKKRLVHFVAYPAFFGLAFAGMLSLTFPYDALKARIRSEARARDVELSIASLAPVPFGVEAKGVELNLFKAAEGRPAAEPLRIDALTLYPRLLPLGVHVRARLLGGQLDAALHAAKVHKLKLRARSLELARLPPEALGSLVMDGSLSLLADLAIDGQDFARTEGRVALLGEEMLLRKGAVQGFTLPRVDLGRVELDLALAEGKARLTTARTTGVDLVAQLEGDIKQARKVALSTPNVSLRFQPSDDFLKRNALVSAALGMAMKKDDDGFYEASLRGTLGALKFVPQKKAGKKK